MKAKSTLSTLVIILAMTVTLPGCRRESLESTPPAKPTSTKAASRVVNIYIWNYNDYDQNPPDICVDIAGFESQWLKATSFGMDGYVGTVTANFEHQTQFIVGILGTGPYPIWLRFKEWTCVSGNATRLDPDPSGTLATFALHDPNDTSPITLVAMFKDQWEE